MSLLTHMERWKDIEGYEGLYQVSTCGRVKSLGNDKSRKERILKLSKDKDGYLKISLCKYGKEKTFQVHRLVAKAFIPNPLNLPCVNHKTENKEFNFCWCLEWVDHKTNSNYGTAIKRRVEKQSKKIICIENKNIFSSIMDAERKTGISHSNIVECCTRKRKSAGGLHWKYVDF